MTTTPTPAPPAVRWRTRLKKHVLRLWERLEQRRRGLSWSAVILGGLVAAVALWPLAAAVWDLLGLTTGQAWRATAAGIGAVLLAAGVVGVNWKPASERTSERTSPVRLFWLILAAWAVAAGAVAAMTGLAWLVLDTPRWQPPQELTPKNLDAIATRAFAIVAGLGGVALLVISYRRQRTTEADAVRAEAANARAELAAEREVAKLFTDTFDSASDKLGSEHAAVRLAGVHALARLADEAPEGREDLVQMVIDVLCAYLRMPYTPAPDPLPEDATDEQIQAHHQQELEFGSFREVRHTIIRIIGDRLRQDTRWRGKDYDFTGVVFDGGDLSGAHFTGGTVNFAGAEFTGGVVSFSGAEFTGGKVNFNDAHFANGMVNFAGARFTDGTVDFSLARFTGGMVYFAGARFTGGTVYFHVAEFTGGKVDFNDAHFTDGMVTFDFAQFTDGKVSFVRARFTGGKVDFSLAHFANGAADFAGARFTDGTATFEGVSGTRPEDLPPRLWPTTEGETPETGSP